MDDLELEGLEIYKLEKIESTSSDDEVNFYVIPLWDARKLISAEGNETEGSNKKNSPIGKLSLKKAESYSDLTIWRGNLTFESRELEGSWEVELGTNFHRVKPYSVVNAQKVRVKELKEKALEEAQALTLWENYPKDKKKE